MKTSWIVIGGVLVVIALYGGVAWYYSVPVRQLLSFKVMKKRPTAMPSPSPSVVASFANMGEQPSATKSVTKTSIDKEEYLYTLYGKFTGPLAAEGENLRGTFILDEDSTTTPITIVIFPTNGKFRLGLSKGTIYGETTWEDKSKEEVVGAVVPGTPAQVWWISSTKDQTAQQALELAAAQKWNTLRGLQLFASAVGVLAR